jgi:uncharacterized membrane protein YccC
MNETFAAEFRVDKNMERPSQIRRHSSWRAFWKLLTFFDRSKMGYSVALRNAAGMVLSLVLGTATQIAFGGPAAACGALFVSYSDGSDPYRHRAIRMIASSVTLTFAAFLGGMFGHDRFGLGVVAGGAAFVAGMAVALGQTAADIGMMALVMLTIFAGQRLTLRDSVETALLALLGGLIQTALSLAFWPVRRYEPERRALALLFMEIGRTATQPIGPGDAPPATVQSSKTQDALRSLRQDSGVVSERFLSLLNQAERARLCVITLLRMQAALESNAQPGEAGETLSRFLAAAGGALAASGEFLLSATGTGLLHDQIGKVNKLIEEWRAHAVGKTPSLEGEAVKGMLFQMDALAGQLRAVEDLVTGSAPLDAVPLGLASSVKSWHVESDSIAATLRANLNFRSVVFRHAVRLTICLTIAGAIARTTGWSRSYWIPMTVILLLRPDFAGTFSRGLQRIAGTIAGLVVATAQIHFLPPTFAVRATLIGICVFLLRWLGPANYGFFAMGVTAAIVLMLSLTGVPPKLLIEARAINTLIGGVLALSAYALWPTREPVEDALAKLLAVYREYFRAVAQRYLGSTADEALVRRERLAARMARSNLEASVERLAAEPSTEPNQIESVRSMMASSHRFVHAIMALETGETKSTATSASPGLQRLVADVETTLLGLERVLQGQRTGSSQMPDLRNDFRVLLEADEQHLHPRTLATVEGDTIVNSVNTLREQILRWQEQQALGVAQPLA